MNILDKIKFKGDKTLSFIVIMLMILSVPVVYSASGYEAYRFYDGDTTSFLTKQFVGVITSIVIIYIVHLVPFKFYFKFSKHFATVTIFLLIITLFWGVEHNGARRWLNILNIIEIQTSDLARVALIMFVARMLTLAYLEKITMEKALIKVLIASVLSVLLIYPADVSTSLILFGVVILLLFIGRVPSKYLIQFFVVIIIFITLYSLVAYAFGLPNRILTGIGRLTESDSAVQTSIAKAAIVKGGFFGEGPGKGVMKYVFSQSHNDFVFAFTVEEYGLFVGMLIVFLFTVFFYRGLAIAGKSNKPFSILLTIGLTLSIVFQAFVHMGVASTILPVTGQTLPFLSAGLTSLFINSFAVGIILNVSRITTLNLNQDDFDKE